MDGPIEIPEEIWEQDIFEPCRWEPFNGIEIVKFGMAIPVQISGECPACEEGEHDLCWWPDPAYQCSCAKAEHRKSPRG